MERLYICLDRSTLVLLLPKVAAVQISGSKLAVMSYAKHWCFTINNPTEDDFPYSDEEALEHFDYVCVGKEVGEQGTPHLQGYVVCAKRMRLAPLSKLLPRAHLLVSRGTPQQASDYCKKDGDYREIGVLPKSPAVLGGDATKLKYELALQKAKDGLIEEIPADLQIRYYNTFKNISKDYATPPPDAEGTTGLWIYGESGCGKSRYVRDTFSDLYSKPINKWWDSYRGQENVLIEDVDPTHAPYMGYLLKIWADRYAFQAECKGHSIMLRPQQIIVTSQYSIEDVWQDNETRVALRRRFKCICMTPDVYKELKNNTNKQLPIIHGNNI